jgi:hypothetical protein
MKDKSRRYLAGVELSLDDIILLLIMFTFYKSAMLLLLSLDSIRVELLCRYVSSRTVVPWLGNMAVVLTFAVRLLSCDAGPSSTP